MAIIYSYPEIPDVQGGDLLLISDTGAPNKPTRSVDIDDLAAYIGTVVGVVQNLQSVLTVGNTYVSPDGYGTFTLNDIANNDGSITFVNTYEGWGYQISAEEGINITDGSGTNLMSIQSSGLSIRNGAQIMNIGTNSLTTTRNVYFPDASGTIALTSDIESYSEWAEYSGTRAGGDLLVSIGDYDDSGNGSKFKIDDDANTVYVSGSELNITDGSLILSGAGFNGQLSASNITAARTLQFPDTSGTIALTSDIPAPGPSGSGTTNYTARWTNASTLGIGALYDNGTNVGIGTTSPAYNLDIQSEEPAIRIKDISDNNSFLVGADNGGAYLGTFTFDSLRFLTDSSEKMRIKQNGNVGIGTNNPGAKLDVNGTTYLRSVALDTIFGYSGNNIAFTNAGNTTFNNSNVGIGTTSPDYALHVDPTVKIGDRQGTDGSLILQSQQGPNITFTSSGDALDISGSTGSSNGNTIRLLDEIKVFEFYPNIGGTIRINRGDRGLMDTNIGGFVVEQQNTTGSNGKSTFLSTDSGGTILRSTSYGSIGTSSDIQFQFGGGSNTSEPAPATKMIIKNNGNVGIGTTSPSQKLEVSGNSLVTGTQFIGDTFTKIQQASGNLLLTNQSSSGAIAFLTNSTERVRITSTGNVGIGTTAPTTKLQVNGDVRIYDENEIYFGGTGSVPHWEIKASGTDLIINDTGTNVGSVLFNNDEGVVLPRLTTTEINAISLPNTGLTVYNTTLNTLCFYNGSSWQKVSHANM